MVLRTMGRMETAADFSDLIITDRNGYPVRIRDIGRVEDLTVSNRPPSPVPTPVSRNPAPASSSKSAVSSSRRS